MAEVEFAVPKMVCEGCAEKIGAALRAFPGVREIKPKVAQKHVGVRYAPAEVGREQLRNVMDEAGYHAVDV